jgi:hypothetical protein
MHNDVCDGRNRFVMLAIRILSVVPNSAGCERQFSAFGRTHTKIRNQLNEQTVHKMSVLKNELMRQHVAKGLATGGAQKLRHHGNLPMLAPSWDVCPSECPTSHISEAGAEDENDINGLFASLDEQTDESPDEDFSDEDISAICHHLGLPLPQRTPTVRKFTLPEIFDFSRPSTITLLHNFWKPTRQYIATMIDEVELIP